jgi:glycosyltransferase involved in cell wall biosynthesis
MELFQMPGLAAGKKGSSDKLRYLLSILPVRNRLASIAQRTNADLMFCNGPRCIWPSTLAAARLGLPEICAVHLIFGGIEQRLLARCFANDAVKRVTFCSRHAAEPFSSLLGGKGTVLWNWVSERFLCAPGTPQAKHLLGLEPQDIAIGLLGRISRTKGQRLLLEALAPELAKDHGLKLLIGGSSDFEDPGEESSLRAMADGMGLRASVRFMGTVENALAFLDGLDILVVPSVWEEPFGLVAAEGMARGLPVVCTNSGGLPEIVEDGVTGLVAEKTRESLHSAVMELVRSPLRREGMGEAARKRAKELFAPEPRLKVLDEMVAELTQK